MVSLIEKLKKGWWTSCSEKEWNESPSCEFRGLFFKDNYFYYSANVLGNTSQFAKMDFQRDRVYIISDFDKNKLNGKLILFSLSWNPVNHYNHILIQIFKSENYIEIDGSPYYNAFSYKNVESSRYR